jgi:hypothetical protein
MVKPAGIIGKGSRADFDDPYRSIDKELAISRGEGAFGRFDGK